MRKLFFLLIFSLSLTAQAGNLWVQQIVSQIDYLYAQDRHTTSYVWSGRFSALNGDQYDVTHFYVSKRPQFNMRTAYTFKETDRLRLSVPLHYDNGYKAALYEAAPFIGGGLIGQWRYRKNLILGMQLHDVLQLGGKLRERPCHDGFERAFHCGTGLPWSDAGPYLNRDNTPASVRFTVDWRF